MTETDTPGFNPDFDDAEWTEAWLGLPIALPPPALHPSGYRVAHRSTREATIFGRGYRLAEPLKCCLLHDPGGRLWMSSTPQEMMMMCNNARQARGHVLVGGLGVGLYPQYAATGAAGQARRFTIVERSDVVRELVEPTLRAALSVPLSVETGDVAEFLARPVTRRYDTIFLDVWDTLDAERLPALNWLRGLAARSLAPGGSVFLWGYRWMVRLFEDACRQLLSVEPGERRTWLATRSRLDAGAARLLTPVADHFAGRAVDDPGPALAWCRQHITRLSAEPVAEGWRAEEWQEGLRSGTGGSGSPSR